MRIFRNFPACPAQPLALSIGNFDGVHLGHQAMLRRLMESARLRTLTTAVMTFEPHPREFFSRPDAPARITSLRDKLQLLSETGIDQVFVCAFTAAFARTTAEAFVRDLLCERLVTRFLLVGDDFRFGANRLGDTGTLRSAARQYGFEVESMDSVTVGAQRVSSTAVRESLARGDLASAARLLGRPYAISGRVVHGQRLGRKLGFPTANIKLGRNRPPVHGIYTVRLSGVGIGNRPGVASLGVRPTIEDAGKPSLEVHLLDFDQNIYGRYAKVEFLKKLRDEEKYVDLATLREQIARDVDAARAFFATRL
jgi:riboflavin kinase / FMN adenylyltransferase